VLVYLILRYTTVMTLLNITNAVSLLKFGRYPVVVTGARVCNAVTMCTGYLE